MVSVIDKKQMYQSAITRKATAVKERVELHF